MTPCTVCGNNAEKTYIVTEIGLNGLEEKEITEYRYWKAPEGYVYCGGECSLLHHERGYQ